MKVALVHDWLIKERGGEKVLDHIARLYPDADIFTLFYRKENLSPEISGHKIYASLLQYIPGIEKAYRYFLPLFPFLIERFALGAYDLVISSSHCVAKGVKTGKNSLHLCYCHTPMRYAWLFPEEYLQGKFYAPLARWVLGLLRNWDQHSLGRVHFFAANSKEVQSRIERFYNRRSEVIYPPLDLISAGDAFE
ncbi:MAG: glycosyltransferase, partial [Candidatus Omnitrophica bacterium]|nr:glycosyltransferase [Candidatus Omnitrophota bacterium]